jgi:F-type H+-transporting ATPase subunit a
MGLEFLTRVRRTSVIVALLSGVVVSTYSGFAAGGALLAGSAWSLVNLFLLQRLVVAITSLDRTSPRRIRDASFAALGTLALFGAGGVLLMLLPPMILLAGFLLPFAVLVLKAASTLLLESRLWKRAMANRWGTALVVASVLVAAWWLVPTRLMTPATASNEATHAESTAVVEHGTEGTVAEGVHETAEHGGAPAHAEGEAHGGGHGESKGPQKFANFITVIARAFPDAPWAHFLHEFEVIIFAMLIGFFICLVAYFATRNPKMIPGPLQNVVEMLVGGLNDFITGILGEKHAKRFVPFLGSLFIYIWFMNLAGLIPFMEAPTSSLNITVALALTVFLYSQWIGLRSLGPVGFVDHLMGSPRNLTGWLLVPLMLPIHILGEFAKPISLSCRLFGNIFGEDMLLVAFVSLGITTLAFTGLPFGLPLQLPFMFLALLTSTLQALVFTVLSTIYFLLMLPHDDHGHEGEAQHAH